jgi:hypothetical protein
LYRRMALALAIIALLPVMAVMQIQVDTPEFDQQETSEADQTETPIPIDDPFLSEIEVRNPDVALKYGIQGYIEITTAPGTPNRLNLTGVEELNITLQLHFVSHKPEFTETVVNLNPKSKYGLTIEQCLGDGRGSVKLNDYVKYSPSGRIVLKASQILFVTMTLRAPEDYPGISIPLGAVGITADIPIIRKVSGYLDS